MAGVEIALWFNSDSSPVDFLTTASNCALQIEASQLPPLNAGFLPESVAVAWHCFFVARLESLATWLLQVWLPVEIVMSEQRRSQLTASA
jgi:hypothetical protein